MWPEAVFFDCDGVLVDSDAVIADVLTRKLGDALSGREDRIREIVDLAWGQHAVPLVADALGELGHAVSAAWLADLDAALDAATEARAAPVEGIAVAARAVPGRKAVVSNAPLAWIAAMVARTGLDDVFEDRLFSAEAVGSEKPDPAVYRHAVESLGVAAERGVAVEDSVAGVVAATRAGLHVIALARSCVPAQRMEQLRHAGASRVITAMSGLPSAIRSLASELSAEARPIGGLCATRIRRG
ncbi:HAD family hydrolase [Azospirillum brasilense]|uniref:HAD family hydrolase n=1 Tax=Azospirillum brasilense TaxID=192 RepID=UPI000E0C2FD0|nr:HAD family phosphatase [Azospirillum brasilense]